MLLVQILNPFTTHSTMNSLNRSEVQLVSRKKDSSLYTLFLHYLSLSHSTQVAEGTVFRKHTVSTFTIKDYLYCIITVSYFVCMYR